MTIPPIFQPTIENRERLVQLLNDPVLIAAIRQVIDDVRIPQSVLNTQLDPLVVRRAAFHEGRASVLVALAALTKPKKDPVPDLDSWEHVEPDTTHI